MRGESHQVLMAERFAEGAAETADEAEACLFFLDFFPMQVTPRH
jgi:hypothetical protein